MYMESPPKSRVARLCELVSSLFGLFNKAKPTIDKVVATAGDAVEAVAAGNVNAVVAAAGEIVEQVKTVDEKVLMELRQVQENLTIASVTATIDEVKGVVVDVVKQQVSAATAATATTAATAVAATI